MKLELRKPYGEVEPNHLSAQRNGQVYAQLPAKSTIDVLENGQFANYHYSAGVVDFDDEGAEWMLVFNEVKLYGEKYNETVKDFALIKDNYTDGIMTPRLLKTAVGDIFTTNTIKKFGGDAAIDYVVGDVLKLNGDGYLEKAPATAIGTMEWTVIGLTTMPDAVTPGLKLQRTK